ncbi:AcrR family transcriptional regulator [Actinoplanes tereljensis]|uniref:HTH tetR-type domain-containing protein n=1 Tax=Paractinoplanes tereljensis TaxID=571912 RepID=A0A919TU03_9ACTN|nr:TetR/AcrR family transcriptional regulator [Actinoplanes tereljensis]GIF21814.1 hypothetical protein Ate02nite_45440 [Actinoplanes tereljensis]
MTTRVDARRNRELVLRAAAQVLAEDGREVSLSRIARRAGVGAGTVYRHFPSKEFLVEAVFAEQIDGFVAAADRWTARAAPGDALFGFLFEVIDKSTGTKPVCDVITADRGWPHALLTAAVQRFRDALDRMLARAKQAGAVRADLRADDLAALIAGGAALRAAHRNRARGTRMVRLLLESLRTESREFRDIERHETCAECGTGLPIRATGRPARFCGPTCRQRARRRVTAR